LRKTKSRKMKRKDQSYGRGKALTSSFLLSVFLLRLFRLVIVARKAQVGIMKRHTQRQNTECHEWRAWWLAGTGWRSAASGRPQEPRKRAPAELLCPRFGGQRTSNPGTARGAVRHGLRRRPRGGARERFKEGLGQGSGRKEIRGGSIR